MDSETLFERSDIIRVKNIDDADFKFRCEGKDYIIKKGEQLLMPGGMANHFLKHFVDHLMIKENKALQMREEAPRKEYVNRIFMGIEKSAAIVERVESLEERESREFAELNGSEEDLTAPAMTQEQADAELPKDEDLFPDPKKEDEEDEFPELNNNGTVSDGVQEESGEGDKEESTPRAKGRKK